LIFSRQIESIFSNVFKHTLREYFYNIKAFFFTCLGGNYFSQKSQKEMNLFFYPRFEIQIESFNTLIFFHQ